MGSRTCKASAPSFSLHNTVADDSLTDTALNFFKSEVQFTVCSSLYSHSSVPKEAAYAMRFTSQSFANSRYAFSIAEKKYFGRQTWSLPTIKASKYPLFQAVKRRIFYFDMKINIIYGTYSSSEVDKASVIWYNYNVIVPWCRIRMPRFDNAELRNN